jgi:hypothetical protein
MQKKNKEIRMKNQKFALLLLISHIYFVSLMVVSSFAWTTPINISNTPGASRYSSMILDALGNIHVVWDDEVPGDKEILYCFNNGICWSSPENISNDMTDSEEVDITIDAFVQLHVVWMDYHLGDILWTMKNGPEWTTPIVISGDFGYSSCPSIAADDSGNVFVAWYEIHGQSDIYFAVFDGASWSMPQNLTNDSVDSAYPDIAVDSEGIVRLVWMDYADINIYYSEYDGISWTEPIDISPLPGWACDPRIVLDSQDYPHVIWEQREDGYHVYYTYYDGHTWSSPYRITGGHYPDIQCGFDDNVHVVWGSNYVIYHSFGSDTSWSVPEEVYQSSGVRCLCPKIEASEEELHIVWTYRKEPDQAEIYYSGNQLTSCEEQYVSVLPPTFRLEQNFPNPFNSKTTIRYQLIGAEPIGVKIEIFNLLGEEVRIFEVIEQTCGSYEMAWDGRDSKGKSLSSGFYFYKLSSGNSFVVRKMLLLR